MRRAVATALIAGMLSFTDPAPAQQTAQEKAAETLAKAKPIQARIRTMLGLFAPDAGPWHRDDLAKSDSLLKGAYNFWSLCLTASAKRLAGGPHAAEAVADSALKECSDWDEEFRLTKAQNVKAHGQPLGSSVEEAAQSFRTEKRAELIGDVRRWRGK